MEEKPTRPAGKAVMKVKTVKLPVNWDDEYKKRRESDLSLPPFEQYIRLAVAEKMRKRRNGYLSSKFAIGGGRVRR